MGTRADYAPPDVPAAITLAEPRLCPRDEAYIRITRTRGARRLGIQQHHGGAFDEGCMTLPPNAADPTQCPVINPAAILHRAGADLVAQKIEGAGGSGLGPCGDMTGDYDAWNMAVGVTAWGDAHTAVSRVAALLEAYDIQGYVGVSVRGLPCVQLE